MDEVHKETKKKKGKELNVEPVPRGGRNIESEEGKQWTKCTKKQKKEKKKVSAELVSRGERNMESEDGK